MIPPINSAESVDAFDIGPHILRIFLLQLNLGLGTSISFMVARVSEVTMKTTFKYYVPMIFSALLLTGCGDDSASFSLLPDTDNFQQSPSAVNTKIDILWVVDNSGSMLSSQENVANNFESFINGFATKGFDFQMAVTTTEAYRAPFDGNPSLARFRDGTDFYGHTGVFIMNPLTEDLEDVFLLNIKQGISGYGHERAFQSMKEALNSPLNAGFLRQNSYTAVIIVSDEEDFSHDGQVWIENINDPALHTIDSYVSYLDQLTGSTANSKNYSVSGIAIYDDTCLAELDQAPFQGIRKKGVRYGQLVDATEGVKASLCGNFSDSLSMIADKIIQGASRFFLSRIPIPESIQVWVNNQAIPPLVDPDTQQTNPLGGWSYDAPSNSVVFVGSTYTPPQGSSIKVKYDPVSYD